MAMAIEMRQLTTRQIELLEDMPFRADEKWYAFLVATGRRTGAWLELASSPWREGDEPLRVSDDVIDRVTKNIGKLGLHVALRCYETEAGLHQLEELGARTRLNHVCDVFVGRDKETAKELAAAVEQKDDHRIGIALGYPKTAVDAYRDGAGISADDLTGEYADDDILDYIWFRLSREHYADEIEIVREWREAFRGTSPILEYELDRLAQS